MINTPHQRSGIDEKIFIRDCMTGKFGQLRSAMRRIPVRSHAVKITEVSRRYDRAGRLVPQFELVGMIGRLGTATIWGNGELQPLT